MPTVPFSLAIDLPSLNVCTLLVAALNTHLLLDCWNTRGKSHTTACHIRPLLSAHGCKVCLLKKDKFIILIIEICRKKLIHSAQFWNSEKEKHSLQSLKPPPPPL